MSLHLVIIGHGQAQDTFDRHEKYWLAHNAPILVCCPENDPLKTEHETLKLFDASHSGDASRHRLMAIFETLSNRSWDRCIIFEYDSFFLEPNVTDDMGLHGIYFENKDPHFLAPRFPNPPWLFERHSFGRIIEKMHEYPSVKERGFADRWIAALAYLSGVPMLSFNPPGFSAGTIIQAHMVRIEELIHAGCRVLHGIKSREILDQIDAFHKSAKEAQIERL